MGLIYGILKVQCSDEVGIRTAPGCSPEQHLGGTLQMPISYGSLDREKESISENATRSIFSWLRTEGYDLHERGIWKHEWFDMSDSNEDGDKSHSSLQP